MFDFNAIGRTALSAIGALILTTTVVGAAVAPAEMVEAAPVAQFAQASDAIHA